MPDIERGECDICGIESDLKRKYYHYDIKCECCRGKHFEIVRYCDKCQPKAPRDISAIVKSIEEE